MYLFSKILEKLRTLFHKRKKPAEDLSEYLVQNTEIQHVFKIPQIYNSDDEAEAVRILNLKNTDRHELLVKLARRVKQREMGIKHGKKET